MCSPFFRINTHEFIFWQFNFFLITACSRISSIFKECCNKKIAWESLFSENILTHSRIPFFLSLTVCCFLSFFFSWNINFFFNHLFGSLNEMLRKMNWKVRESMGHLNDSWLTRLDPKETLSNLVINNRCFTNDNLLNYWLLVKG